MQKNEILEFISYSADDVQNKIDEIGAMCACIETAYDLIELPIVHVCKSEDKFVLAAEMAHTKQDIISKPENIREGAFEYLSTLTLAQAIRNHLVDAQTWEYMPENALAYLEKYTP